MIVMRYCGYVPDDWKYEHDALEAEGTPVEKGAGRLRL